MNAVERYLLDEMSEEERAIFEEHFFDCGDCMAAITAGTQLMIAGKAVAKEDGSQPVENPPEIAPGIQAGNVLPMPARKRWRWVPQAAAASLLLAFGAQIPRVVQMVRPDALRLSGMVPIAVGQIRGGPDDVSHARPGDVIYFDITPPDPQAHSYVANLNRRGKSLDEVTISLEHAMKSVPLLLGELPAGSYVLVIESVRKDGKRYPVASSVIEVGER